MPCKLCSPSSPQGTSSLSLNVTKSPPQHGQVETRVWEADPPTSHRASEHRWKSCAALTRAPAELTACSCNSFSQDFAEHGTSLPARFQGHFTTLSFQKLRTVLLEKSSFFFYGLKPQETSAIAVSAFTASSASVDAARYPDPYKAWTLSQILASFSCPLGPTSIRTSQRNSLKKDRKLQRAPPNCQLPCLFLQPYKAPVPAGTILVCSAKYMSFFCSDYTKIKIKHKTHHTPI